MRDGYMRKIDYLRLSVTDRCNFRCVYCMPEEGVLKRQHADMLSVEEMVEIVRAFVALGVTKVRITGGEPLVHRAIVEIIRRIAVIDGLRELCLTTNGVWLAQLARPLKEAGVTRLNVSLDTLRPNRFARITRAGSLEETLRGIRAAEEAGFTNMKINTVLLGGINIDEIPDFVNLTREKDVQVRFIELMPLGVCAAWDRSAFIAADTVLDAVPALEPIRQERVARIYRLPGAVGTVGLIRPLSDYFCPECNRVRVTADGRLKVCLHSDREVTLKGLIGETLRDTILAEIKRKPERHLLTPVSPSETSRDMNRIGG